MLDLRRLMVFREVAERRSFSEAAVELNYTQSSVSQHVTNLERELGVTLLDRGARPVALTAAGEVVLRHADELLGRSAAIERELAALAGGEAGRLRLGGFYTAWATFLPAAVATYARDHPRVELGLRQIEPEPATRALLAGELDLAVVYRYPAIEERAAEDRVDWLHLFDDPYAVALPAGHPLARRKRVPLADLASERWVSPPGDTPYAGLLRRLCREHGGFDPHVVFATADIAMAQPLVASGLAVSLLPQLALRPQLEGVAVRPLESVPPARAVEVGLPATGTVPTVAGMVEALGARRAPA